MLDRKGIDSFPWYAGLMYEDFFPPALKAPTSAPAIWSCESNFTIASSLWEQSLLMCCEKRAEKRRTTRDKALAPQGLCNCRVTTFCNPWLLWIFQIGACDYILPGLCWAPWEHIAQCFQLSLIKKLVGSLKIAYFSWCHFSNSRWLRPEWSALENGNLTRNVNALQSAKA